jgi:DnaJ-class molecular chaperone
VPDYLDWQRSKEDKEERSRRASMAAAIGNADRAARRGAKRGAFRTQRDRERYKGLSACEKCEGQGWLWITSDRAGSCPECKGAGEKRAES